MKRIYFLFASSAFLIVFLMACEKSSMEVDEFQLVKKEFLLKADKAEKVTICHYDKELEEWFQISISSKGLNGHDGFGDQPRHEMDIFDDPLVDTDGDGIGDCADCYPDDASQGEKTTWYQDADGDSLGNPEVSIESCFEQEGHVSNSDDDDDTPA